MLPPGLNDSTFAKICASLSSRRQPRQLHDRRLADIRSDVGRD